MDWNLICHLKFLTALLKGHFMFVIASGLIAGQASGTMWHFSRDMKWGRRHLTSWWKDRLILVSNSDYAVCFILTTKRYSSSHSFTLFWPLNRSCWIQVRMLHALWNNTVLQLFMVLSVTVKSHGIP